MSRKTARNPVEILEEEFSTNWLLNFKIKRPFYFNPKHKEFYESIIDTNTKISFVDGPAGTAKTYIAVYAALELLKEGDSTTTNSIRRLNVEGNFGLNCPVQG